MKKRRQLVGKWGEKIAALYLEGKGYQIYRRNVRTPHGEIDLIALDEDFLVFVEVKTRTTNSYGYPETSITATKKEHMLAAAQHFLLCNQEFGEDWRIDVIAIRGDQSGPPPEIIHFENALTS